MKIFKDKKSLKNLIWVLFFVLIALLFKKYIFDGTIEHLSQIDNRVYKVRSGSNPQRRADLLAFIRMKLDLLVDTLSKDQRYVSDPDVQRLISNWNKGVTIKEIGNMESDAAYVMNKQHMSFCLQDSPEPGKPLKNTNIEDTNLITYVGIHELAHIMSIETEHGPEYIRNFEFLLGYAQNINYTNPFTKVTEKLYIPLNNLQTADNYCGVELKKSIN
jgi:hypothetical protein